MLAQGAMRSGVVELAALFGVFADGAKLQTDAGPKVGEQPSFLG